MPFSKEGGAEPVNEFECSAGNPKLPSENIKRKKKFCSVMRLDEQLEVEVAENLTFALGRVTTRLSVEREASSKRCDEIPLCF